MIKMEIKKRIRVAVIGVGSMGQNHARVFFNSENAELVAVADSYLEQAENIAKKYHAKPYADYKEMLDQEDIDAVSIAVPTCLHKEVALYALTKGKHILLEKPIASTEPEAKEIIACAVNHKCLLMIGHIERFNAAVIELKKRINDLGDIYKIDVQRIGPFPSRITDVGVITDLSVHDLDIINYLIESEPSHIYAETQQRLHPHCEDSVTAIIQYKNGVSAILNINYLSPTKIRQLKVFGKKGMFEVNYLNQELFFYENKSFSSDNWESVTEGDMKKIIIPKKEPLQVELESFLECIRLGLPASVPGEHGLKVLSTANQLLTSAQTKQVIILP
ncbi:Gfo/Idh/MocA family oxidoreductase [Candidatus Woesearchaeota archaeon]|nr:Gfo/Idh/MocA family oxidoreductase [Candidatus Woesearchaeota archaeon]